MIQVDISNIWGGISLPDLLGAEREVFQAHFSLAEQQPDWMVLPDSRELDRLLAAAEQIREESDVLIVLGAGNICSGPRAVMELLQSTRRTTQGCPRIFFTGSDFSTRNWQALMEDIEGKNLSLCLISQGNPPPETAIAFRNLKWILERRYGTDEARQRIYAITTSRNDEMIREEGWEHFSIPETGSASFSILSPAGLLPMAVAGIDIRALLQGVSAAKAELDLRSFDNPAWLYAAARSVLHRKGRQLELLSTFEGNFSGMGSWWQQLFCGSAGLIPVPASFPGDLHAMNPMIQARTHNLLETMIRLDPAAPAVIIGEDARNLDNLNHLAGKSLADVEEAAFQDILEAHSDSGIPVVTIDVGVCSEESLGQLIWFFLLSCALCGCMAETPISV